jgi:hypothetical protein
MALSEDQKAMLRLLAQRGEEGYADLSALLGVGVDEVHAKARAAAAQLEAEGIPAPAVPSPPGSTATDETPEPRTVATPPPRPAEAEPAAPSPPPQPPASASTTAKASKPASPGPRRVALPSGSGARAAIAAGALVVVALIVVLIVGGGDDSGSTTTTTGSGESNAAEEAVNANTGGGKEVTQAILEPIGNSGANGIATFGRVKNSLALQLEASGLEPTGPGESYTVWLYESPQKMLPLASTRVGKSGQIGVQVEVPTEVLGYLANEAFDQIDVSLTDDGALKASLAKATSEKKAPIYTGTDVLRGRITGPIIGAAKK